MMSMPRDTASSSRASAKLDGRVDAYIENASPAAQPVLHRLRSLVHEAVPDVTEDIKWSKPFFLCRGEILAYMAAFQRHCAFGFWSREMTALLAADGIDGSGSAGSFGKITGIEDLPSPRVMVAYLRKGAALLVPGESRFAADEPRRTGYKAPLPLPPSFAAALALSPVAQANFTRLAPSCRREYLAWIGGAKRPETQSRRVAKAITAIADGRRFDSKRPAGASV